MDTIRKICIVFFFIILLSPVYGQGKLSREAQISILISAPYEEMVFTVYGHAALRVHDPSKNLDTVFNYGLFDFSKPNFIYRFVKGETDYKLGAANYFDYIVEYQMRGSDVTELVLNLTPKEKERIWHALLINIQPENAVYRYNFFFDNCATRLPAIVEKHIEGEIYYNYQPAPQSFREMINYCTRNHLWQTFGCDLVLGVPADRIATPHEMMFLPEYLKVAFDNAIIINQDGSKRKLVNQTIVIDAVEADETPKTLLDIFTPLVCSLLLFISIALLSFREWKKRSYYLIIDILLFSLAGFAGIILFFLCFISEHPGIWPNWSVIWLHPIHLIGLLLFCVKKWRKAAFYYHFINFALLSLMLIGWNFIPQHLNVAFIPLVATLWLRSLSGIGRYKKQFE